ncbi:alpha/beta hydrolase [Caballeronia udeis]|uniref:Alpha/beta hydrolase n=1 Tax=Caballeronia udeis TaxID=1232866 RepID=A0A158JIH0_9BURK|nr:alpha/beta hydrolase [Caballeronia udeis]SAL68677.1 alpha/beta hydrolase [Caballeronia udeis]
MTQEIIAGEVLPKSVWAQLAGVPFAQSYYDVKGIRTRVLEAGEGEPLILLHGTGGHADGYLRVIGKLAERFHVYALDMLGHGYTDTANVEIEIEALKAHVSDFIDTVTSGPVILSGESLGAVVASWYAIENPERVRRLVLNTGIPMPLDAQGKQQVQDGLERSRQASSALTREAIAKRLAWLMLNPEMSVTPELIDIRYDIYAQPGRAKILAGIAQTVMGSLVSGAWDDTWLNSSSLRDVACPTLLIWTGHNPGQSAERAAEAAKYIPDHRMVVLSGSAHWPQWEEPEAFVRHHVDFLCQ